MGRFVRGDVLVVPFPFSDLTRAKRRPALVLAAPTDGDDVVLCQITSQSVRDRYAIPLDSSDFGDGGIHKPSQIRPNRIFTADERIVLYRAGGLTTEKKDQVIEAVVRLLRE